eukprot:TRINITY_DN24900_c0_g1_i1.p2 TRINITY_DN24900_c0_g1~~TRINITY_DN24900_c0_g1_i1.p2  ORF type:complete len:115 (+),score=4.28 TRINITY_DN24900_c0_g1_i1:153-497(+)
MAVISEWYLSRSTSTEEPLTERGSMEFCMVRSIRSIAKLIPLLIKSLNTLMQSIKLGEGEPLTEEVYSAHELLLSIKPIYSSILGKESTIYLSLIHICRCRRYAVCRSRWSPDN